jgi:hypothetical protein
MRLSRFGSAWRGESKLAKTAMRKPAKKAAKKTTKKAKKPAAKKK